MSVTIPALTRQKRARHRATGDLPARRLRFDDDGNNHGSAAVLRVDPTPDDSTNRLLELVGVPDARLGCLGERRNDLWFDVVEHGFVFREPASVDFRPDEHFSGVHVNCDKHGDKAFFSEYSAVFEVGVRDFPDARPVNVNESEVELSGNGHDAVFEVDDGAVLSDDRVLLRNTGFDGERRVGVQVAGLAVDGEHVSRFDDVVAIQQLPRRCVSGDVHLGVAFVDDVCTDGDEPVDHSVHGVLVTGNQRGGENDGVAFADFDLVLFVGDS